LIYSFEDFSLDAARRELRRGSAVVSLQRQVFDVLEYLIRNRERVVSKDDLLTAVWNGRIVSESTLFTRINAARSAIGDSGEEQRLIRTAHGKGIRFVGAVREEEETVRKLAAIFAADVAGYSWLMGQDEVGTLRRLTACRAILDKLIAAHRGRVFGSAGDSIVADFASAVDAVECAVAAQEALAGEELLRFRIGVHVGDVIVQGENLFGDGVNIAARLEALAEPGGICISGTVGDQIGTKLPIAVTDLGEQQVKNIAQPIRAYRVGGASVTAIAAPSLPLPEKPSIAVLPFQNLSGDPEQEYFADGMVEEITTALSKVRWFFVIARNSSFTYKGRAIDVKQVVRELGVRYVLEGSVRKAGNRVRISAQLINTETGSHVWAERYDRELADIFAVQDEITERVVAAIEPELYAAEHFRSRRKPPESLDAWECVVRALSFAGHDTRTGLAEAEALCRRAIAIAPGYGQAHSLLAWTLVRRTSRSGGDLSTALPEAMAEARTGLGLDDRDPWAHHTHGVVLWRMRRHGEAVRAFRRALELNPNFASAHAHLALPLAIQGAHEKAVGSAEQALRLSPRDLGVAVFASVAMAAAHFAARRYADSVAWARKAIERSPEHLPAYFFLIASAAMHGDRAAAAEGLAALLHLQSDFSLAWMRKNMAYSEEVGERLLVGLRTAGIPDGLTEISRSLRSSTPTRPIDRG
jgi:TolB-like protein/DNA-binding winged helix-turn-helix (wHTH) protein